MTSTKRVFEPRTNSYVNNFPVNSWQSWKKRYSEQLSHIAGFEERFVDDILLKINLIEPKDVIPQYHFKDQNGGNRYIDFMIVNEDKKYCLPIELDGYSKMVGNGKQYHVFNDFLQRQNAIIAQFGMVLRYTNKTMINASGTIIQEITTTLNKQAANLSVDSIGHAHEEKLLEDMLSRVQQTVQEQAHNDNTKLTESLNKLNRELKELKSQQTESDYATTAIIRADNAELSKTLNQLSQEIKSLKEQQEKLEENSSYDSSDAYRTPDIAEITTQTPPPTIEVHSSTKQNVNASSLTNEVVTNDYSQKKPKKGILITGLVITGTIVLGFVFLRDDNNAHTENLKVPIGTTASNVVSTNTLLASEQTNSDDSQNLEPSVEPQSDPPSSYDQAIANTIPSSEVAQYIGDYGVVCGHVANIKDFDKGTYLNIGASYPNQHITFVVWNSDKTEVGGLDKYQGQDLCLKGTIDSYRGKPQMKFASLRQVQSR